MASVFGITTVKKVTDTKASGNKRFQLECEEEGRKMTLCSSVAIPIGSKIYWEHWYRQGKWVFTLMNPPITV